MNVATAYQRAHTYGPYHPAVNVNRSPGAAVPGYDLKGTPIDGAPDPEPAPRAEDR
jgi:hypothetical protein